MRNGKPETRTKVVCTIGPACSDPGTIAGMALAGMDAARINSSHTPLQKVASLVEMVRSVSRDCSRRVSVLLDLKGPRLRVGEIEGGQVELESGKEILVTGEPVVGNKDLLSIPDEALARGIPEGVAILLDDGLIRLRVVDSSGMTARCIVEEGGILKQGKGVNVLGAKLEFPSFTENDRAYLQAGIEAGVDWVAQSFVGSEQDVISLRSEAERLGGRVFIMAKIENREALQNIERIIKVSDGVMVARGDLGVELDAEEVPIAQKRIIRKCRLGAVPVTTATQMLESMVENPRPTRAEASDVANAILDGTDAVMLSAETAIGRHPVTVVETMVRIIARAEDAVDYKRLLEWEGKRVLRSAAEAIGYSACRIAWDLKAKAIITMTRSGYTARLISSYRPKAMIIAISPDERVVRGTSMMWGVEGVMAPVGENLKEAIHNALVLCRDSGLLESGDLAVVTGGFVEERVGTTNTVSVRTVP